MPYAFQYADSTVFLINGFEERGDLQTFLRNKRQSGSNTELTEANLLTLAENVAEGMAHLSQQQVWVKPWRDA